MSLDAADATDFDLTSHTQAPSWQQTQANIDAIKLLRQIIAEGRPATPAEQARLAKFTGWGASPDAFRPEKRRGHVNDYTYKTVRELLGDEWDAARRSTINAHYTPIALARGMWDLAARLGYQTGQPALEVGCGTGIFIGTAPDIAAMTGVELDPTTAQLARLLYPSARIINSAIEQCSIDDDSFALAIGNVPFANIKPHDRRRPGHSLHNYCILRALDAVAPGGHVIVLTSRYTLDATGRRSREALAERANLLTAIRFPSGAFQDVAGTKAIIDLVVFRKRRAGEASNADEWIGSNPVELPRASGHGHADVPINDWFAAHPELILGEVVAGRGQYANDELLVVDGAQGRGWPTRFAELAATVEFPEATTAAAVETTERIVVDLGSRAQAGMLTVVDGRPVRLTDRHGTSVPFDVADGDRPEFEALCTLRDIALHVLHVQRPDRYDPTALAAGQQELRERYDAYTARFGPVNRFTWAGGKATKVVDDEERPSPRRYPRMGGFRTDPFWSVVAALEVFDDETGEVVELAPIFTRRIVNGAVRPERADTVADAVGIVLADTGGIIVSEVGKLVGKPLADVLAEMQATGIAYRDPVTNEWIEAAAYLSGNVRAKHAAAVAAAATDPKVLVNVDALAAVLPEWLTAGEIDVRLGAPWIDAPIVEQFLASLVGHFGQFRVDHVSAVGFSKWKVDGGKAKQVASARQVWGTGRLHVFELVEACLNQRLVEVYDTVDTEWGEKRVLNTAETAAAREKQAELQEQFATWLWSDPQRTTQLEREYNERFNSLVAPRYSGAHLTVPELADGFTPYPHQLAAAWRVAVDGSSLIAHPVGRGKTLTSGIIALTLRRLGRARKPLFVVPNGLVEQAVREIGQRTPGARILAVSDELGTKAERARLTSTCAAGDWDLVVMPMTTFGMIPLSPAGQAAYLSSVIEEFETAIAAAEAAGTGRDYTVKELEKAKARIEAKHAQLLAAERKDGGLWFEDLGVDCLLVDELHNYKNREIITGIQAARLSGAKRSEDLAAKLAWLRAAGAEVPLVGFTATPVSNSISEMWVMSSYIRPDLLVDMGVDSFDAWAAMFASTVTMFEMTPDGSGFRTVERFARFANLPELCRMWLTHTDTLPADRTGRPNVTRTAVAVPGTDTLKGILDDLVERYKGARERKVTDALVRYAHRRLDGGYLDGTSEKEQQRRRLFEAIVAGGNQFDVRVDNVLGVTADGRMAATDPRLVDAVPDGPTKLDEVAAQVIARYHAQADRRYLDDRGQPSERAGSFQLVACDFGTPGGKSWALYDELARLLTAGGIPRGEIRFAQDAKGEAQRSALWAACRDGRVRVLIGSVETCGVGVNVQTRLSALHRVNPHWKPALFEQLDGRIDRPGNQNTDVEILNYVTEASFDGFMYGGVARKAGFLAQLASGQATDRVMFITDVDDNVITFEELKALASGNPLVLRKAEIDANVAKLQRRRSVWRSEQGRRTWAAQQARRAANQHQEKARDLRRIVDAINLDDDKTIINYLPAESDDEANATFRAELVALTKKDANAPSWSRKSTEIEVHALRLRIHETVGVNASVEVRNRQSYSWATMIDLPRLAKLQSPIDGLRRWVAGLPKTLTGLEQMAASSTADADTIAAAVEEVWPFEAELATALAEQAEVNALLAEETRPAEPETVEGVVEAMAGGDPLIAAALTDVFAVAGFAPRAA